MTTQSIKLFGAILFSAAMGGVVGFGAGVHAGWPSSKRDCYMRGADAALRADGSLIGCLVVPYDTREMAIDGMLIPPSAR
jgi:hypothetical protein